MEIEAAQHPELEELKRDVAPEKVLDTLDHAAAITRATKESCNKAES